MNFWHFLVNDFFLLIFCIIFLVIIGHALIRLINWVKRMLKNYREKKSKIEGSEEADIVDPVCL
ncbi:MAG TPA: hypothetical protein PLQ44_02895 [Candidatus Paceibacterota bacterium]|jgi:hypothetical protein|nr:hypothetical protein [Candidatus Paceibacterota bacterium]